MTTGSLDDASAAQAMHPLRWFITRRHIRPIEVIVGAWSSFFVMLLALLAGWIDSGDGLWLLVGMALTLVSTVACFNSSWRLVRSKRFILGGALICFAVASLFLVDLIKFDRCPHARYVTVFGISITVTGKACHNERDWRPWWVGHARSA